MAFLTINFSSQVLLMGEKLNVILPDDFNESDPIENHQKKFPVLYLLHGYFGNNNDWIRFSSIERYASEHHIAVVMPSAYNSYYTNGLNGLNYFDYVAIEVPKIAQKYFPISKDPRYNYIAGLSMGGYGALKIALTYPDRFSFAASISGALDIEFNYQTNIQIKERKQNFISLFGEHPDFTKSKDNLFYLASQIKKPIPNLYINCGNEDFLNESNHKFHHHLKALNIPHVFETYPGAHSWLYWDTHIQNVLKQIKAH